MPKMGAVGPKRPVSLPGWGSPKRKTKRGKGKGKGESNNSGAGENVTDDSGEATDEVVGFGEPSFELGDPLVTGSISILLELEDEPSLGSQVPPSTRFVPLQSLLSL